MSKKVNKFKVGDEVEIVSLEKTVSRFGGEDFILPIGSISVDDLLKLAFEKLGHSLEIKYTEINDEDVIEGDEYE